MGVYKEGFIKICKIYFKVMKILQNFTNYVVLIVTFLLNNTYTTPAKLLRAYIINRYL